MIGPSCSVLDIARSTLGKNFRTFNAIDTSGAYAVPVAMGIGDTLKIQFAYPAGGVARNLNEYIQFDAGNLLQLTSCTATIDGTPIVSGASMAAYIDGKLHDIEITATAAISVGYIGQNGAAGAFYAGQVLANIFTISGVTTHYIIDNDSVIYTQARGYGLGVEEVTNGTFDTDVSGWTPNANTTLSLVSNTMRLTAIANGIIHATQSFTTVIGETYIASMDITAEAKTGDMQLGLGNVGGATTWLDTTTSTGTLSVMFVATATTTYVTARGDGLTLTGETFDVDNISVREAPASIIWSTFTAAYIEQYTYNAPERMWEGVDRVVNGGFDAGSTGWTLAGEDGTHILTFADSAVRYQSDTTTPQLSLSQSALATVGSRYKFEVDTSIWISGAIKTDTIAGASVTPSVGTYTLVGTAASTTLNITRATTNVDLTISRVSLKQVLEYV